MLRILRDSLKTSGMAIVQLAATAIASVLWARAIGPAEMGEFLLAIAVASTAAFVCNPSLYAAANYFISAKKATAQSLWWTHMILTAMVSGVAVLAAVAAFFLLRGGATQRLPFVALMTVGTISYHNFSAVLYGSQRVTRVTLWSAGWGIIYLLLTIYMLAGDHAATAWQPIVAYSLTQGLQGLGLIGLAYPNGVSRRWNGVLAREMVRYGMSVYFGRIATFLNQRLDTFLIVTLLNDEALGLYGVATTFAELLWQLPNAVNLVLLANIATLAPLLAIRRTEYTGRLIFTIVLGGACLLGIVGGWLVPLVYGETYVGSVAPLLWLLPGIIMLSTFGIIETHFRALDRPLIPSYAAAFGVLINIVCNLILIPRYQLVGAAIASTIAYSVQSIWLAALWGRQTKQNGAKLFFPILRRYR
ncbi:MAG: lipopolysaccharide biosynthesis protein [Candidatus Promineifilaceae bacterium]